MINKDNYHMWIILACLFVLLFFKEIVALVVGLVCLFLVYLIVKEIQSGPKN